MEEMSFTQEEWLAWRKIGASDAAAILGKNPYKSAYQLWVEKVYGAKDVDNVFTRHGKKRETPILDLLESEYGAIGRGFYLSHAFYPELTASLDGWQVDTSTIFEAKAPQDKAFKEMVEKDEVPFVYYCQMQHAMYVADASNAVFVAENAKTKERFVKEVSLDSEFLNMYIPKALEFWELVKSKTPPPLTSEDKLYLANDPLWESYAEELSQIKKEMETLKAREKEIRDSLIAHVEPMGIEKGVYGHGISLSKRPTAGRLNYERLREDGIDLEAYKTEGKMTYFLTLTSQGPDDE